MSTAPRNVRVLLVEDEVNMARTLAKILQRKGFHVATVANGKEALAELASARPDVYAHPEVQKIPYSKASMDTNAVAIAKPTIPESPEITDILARELSGYLAGAKSAQEALDTAAVDMNKLLGDCAPLKYPVQ